MIQAKGELKHSPVHFVNSKLRVKQVKATSIFLEEEVEYELRLMVDVVKEQLKSVMVPAEGSLRIEMWQPTLFYDIKVICNYICHGLFAWFLVSNVELIVIHDMSIQHIQLFLRACKIFLHRMKTL